MPKINLRQLNLPLFPLVRRADIKRWQRWANSRIPTMLMPLSPIRTIKGLVEPIPYVARLHKLIEQRFKDDPSAVSLIENAFRLAWKGHSGIFRKSGEPYIEHPLAVAEIVSNWGLDAEAVSAALCHDVIEDAKINGAKVTRRYLSRHLNERVALLVDGVTELGKEDEFKGEKPLQDAIYAKMLEYSVRDRAILPLKLADRLHNMRTLSSMPAENQDFKSSETMKVYVPIADRMGIWSIKRELEDLSFLYLEPKLFDTIKSLRSHLRFISESKLQKVVREMHKEIGSVELLLERRGVYEIHERMRERQISLDDLSPSDIWRLNIIIPEGGNCYAVLDRVHAMYAEVRGEFATYIYDALPNDHRFLHDYVEVPSFGKLLIQIRDQEMYDEYQLGELSGARSDRNWHKKTPRWVRSTLNYLKAERGRIEEGKVFRPPIVVYTPAGDAIDLHLGDTVLDFARAINQEIFIHAVDAVVGQRRAMPLTYVLGHGDRVEVRTDAKARPELSWMEHVNTDKAIASLRTYLTHRKNAKIFRDALDEFGRQLEKHFLKEVNFRDSKLFSGYLRKRGYPDAQPLMLEIGRGERLTSQVIGELVDLYRSSLKKVKAEGARLAPHIFGVDSDNVAGILNKLTNDLAKLRFNIRHINQVHFSEEKARIELAIDILDVSDKTLSGVDRQMAILISSIAQVQRQQLKFISEQIGEQVQLNPKVTKLILDKIKAGQSG